MCRKHTSRKASLSAPNASPLRRGRNQKFAIATEMTIGHRGKPPPVAFGDSVPEWTEAGPHVRLALGFAPRLR
jgi:hypothetical protein